MTEANKVFVVVKWAGWGEEYNTTIKHMKESLGLATRLLMADWKKIKLQYLYED